MTEQKLLESHPIEKQMGILYYCTKQEGTGGKLRVNPKDFKVEEITPAGKRIKYGSKSFSLGKSEPGLNTEFVLEKRHVESHQALLRITEALGIPHQDLSVAGTKDKKAVTAQRATVWRVPAEKLLELQLKGIRIKAPRTTIYKTYLGDLQGNHFTIKIREVTGSKGVLKRKLSQFKKEFKSFGGIGNYFGHQRFGARRPISHLVGKLLFQKKIEEAVMKYLTDIYETETKQTTIARKTLKETNDPERAYKLFSPNMIFERRILKYLTKYPGDYTGALSTLPRNLLKMFYHSYQSYLWNLTLSERIRIYGNLLPHPDDFMFDGQQVLPIIGSETKFNDSILSNFMRNLLEEEGITMADFGGRHTHNLRFSGSNRAMVIKPANLECSLKKYSDSEFHVILQFSLNSGSYATVVLRELLKSTPINY